MSNYKQNDLFESSDSDTDSPEFQKASERSSELRKLINHHNRLYYINAEPEISDREYDTLYRELTDIEKKFPSLKVSDSPTARVGGEPLKEFATIAHAEPMMSLDNTYSKEELIEFHDRTEKLIAGMEFNYIVEPKVDGVAISITYINGVLEKALTRGDGRRGDDVTENIRTIRSIPLHINSEDPPALLEVRGEIYMTRSGFAEVNIERTEAGLSPFANPRNAAAGSLKLLDSREVAKRPLDAAIYGTGALEGFAPPTHEELLTALKEWGLPAPPFYDLCAGISDVLNVLDVLESRKNDFSFEIDGAVIKVNQRELYASLGATAKSPRYSIAYKYEPEQAETKINGITVQVGRTGILTPVAELEPVFISGSTVSRATLHNIDEIRRKDTRVGDYVLIEKAGEIIPAVVSVNKAKRSGSEIEFMMPETCPVCGEPVVQRDGEVATRCENMQCPAQLKCWITHFASRAAMDIDGLGDAIVDALVDSKLVTSPADLYSLKLEDIEELPRMGSKSAINLLNSIEQSRKQELWRLIHGLGIRQIGAKSARTIEENFSSLDELIQADPDKLQEIPAIGPVVAEKIVDFFRNPLNSELIERLRAAGVNMTRTTNVERTDKLEGMSFVITGTLEGMTRQDAEAIVRKNGGRTSSSVSSKTDFLIAGANAGSKLQKAEKLGVTVLSLQDLLDRV